MMMRLSFMFGVAAVLLSGCVALRDEYDIRPVSSDGVPTAVEWQNDKQGEIARETDVSALVCFVETPAAAGALLSEVRGAYETDPLVATKIAAVTQLVADGKRTGAEAHRAVWCEALLSAAQTSADAYRKVFFLEQLRWCGRPDDIPAIRALGEGSSFAEVKSFTAIVVRELERK